MRGGVARRREQRWRGRALRGGALSTPTPSAGLGDPKSASCHEPEPPRIRRYHKRRRSAGSAGAQRTSRTEPQPDPRAGQHRTPRHRPGAQNRPASAALPQTRRLPAPPVSPSRPAAVQPRTELTPPTPQRRSGREPRGGRAEGGRERPARSGAASPEHRRSPDGLRPRAGRGQSLKAAAGSTGGARRGGGSEPPGTGLGCESCSAGRGEPGGFENWGGFVFILFYFIFFPFQFILEMGDGLYYMYVYILAIF